MHDSQDKKRNAPEGFLPNDAAEASQRDSWAGCSSVAKDMCQYIHVSSLGSSISSEHAHSWLQDGIRTRAHSRQQDYRRTHSPPVCSALQHKPESLALGQLERHLVSHDTDAHE